MNDSPPPDKQSPPIKLVGGRGVRERAEVTILDHGCGGGLMLLIRQSRSILMLGHKRVHANGSD